MLSKAKEVSSPGRPAGLVAATDGQINLLVPDLEVGAKVPVTVRRSSLQSAPVMVTIVEVAPAIFLVPLGAELWGAITDVRGEVIRAASPAVRGQILTVYLTGLGSSDPLPGSDSLRTNRVVPRMMMDGREAAVLFAGPNPVFPGLDQINFVVPDSTSTGTEVRVWVEQRDRRSNIVSVPMR